MNGLRITIFLGVQSTIKKNGLTKGTESGNIQQTSAGQNIVELDF